MLTLRVRMVCGGTEDPGHLPRRGWSPTKIAALLAHRDGDAAARQSLICTRSR